MAQLEDVEHDYGRLLRIARAHLELAETVGGLDDEERLCMAGVQLGVMKLQRLRGDQYQS